MSALRDAKSHARLWIMAAAGIAIDLWSKDWAFSTLREPRVVLKGILSLHLSLNPGALFGLGAGLAPVFVGASVLALLFVLYLFSQSTPHHRSLHVALGMVLAGAVGNLYDRTFMNATVVVTPTGRRDVGKVISQDAAKLTLGDFPTGASPRMYWIGQLREPPREQPVVRDFLSIDAVAIGYRMWPWIFNIADMLLVVGVGLLLLNFWTDRHRRHVSESTHMGEPAPDPADSVSMPAVAPPDPS